MTELVIPSVGTSGYWQLRSPLENLMVENERYTCKAVRNLSDYLANNENPKADIYAKYQIPDDDYEADILSDAFIVSLQSAQGHWAYVPAKFIVTYPITNGVPYRAVLIGISLPSLPADRDTSFLHTSLRNLVTDSLGVDCVIKEIETSRVVLVPSDKHIVLQGERDVISGSKVTDRARYLVLANEHEIALNKIQMLEKYILDNYVDPVVI
jgi:hypothetical protein